MPLRLIALQYHEVVNVLIDLKDELCNLKGCEDGWPRPYTLARMLRKFDTK